MQLFNDYKGSMEIFIKFSNGRNLPLYVEPYDTVLMIKNKFCYNEGTFPDNQRLVFNDKQLQDNL